MTTTNISIKSLICASCKIITTENLQSGKILNKVNSVKHCDLHKKDYGEKLMIFKRCKICYRFIDLQLGKIYNGAYCHEYSDFQDNIEWDDYIDIATDLVDN